MYVVGWGPKSAWEPLLGGPVMRIKRIVEQVCEIIKTDDEYFGDYRRCPEGRWYHRMGDSWVELGFTEDYEREYERFKQQQEISKRREEGQG